jgi:hypothetical protein
MTTPAPPPAWIKFLSELTKNHVTLDMMRAFDADTRSELVAELSKSAGLSAVDMLVVKGLFKNEMENNNGGTAVAAAATALPAAAAAALPAVPASAAPAAPSTLVDGTPHFAGASPTSRCVSACS